MIPLRSVHFDWGHSFKKHNYIQFELQRKQFYFSIEIVPNGCFVQE